MLLLGGSYITWSLLMFLLQKYYRDDLTFNSYIVAFIHAVISCRCCELVWYIEQSMKLDQFGGDLTTPQYYAISFSAGYILYDTILGFHTDKKLYIMVHHFITLFTLVFALLVEKCGPELILSTWGAEISGPCLNMRTFFQNSRFKSSMWSLVNDIWIGRPNTKQVILVSRFIFSHQNCRCHIFSGKFFYVYCYMFST